MMRFRFLLYSLLMILVVLATGAWVGAAFTPVEAQGNPRFHTQRIDDQSVGYVVVVKDAMTNRCWAAYARSKYYSESGVANLGEVPCQ